MSERIRAIITSSEANPDAIRAFGSFRKTLFVDRLGWQLVHDGHREFDQFDTPRALYGLLLQSQEIVGGFRALRTDEPYLAASVFPQLAVERPYPSAIDVWEISRFGTAAGNGGRRLALINYALMFRFAAYRGASALVAIADLAHERYLAAAGIVTRRYGPPVQIALNGPHPPITIVAGEIPVRRQGGERFHTLISAIKHTEITDETLVLGSVAVPA